MPVLKSLFTGLAATLAGALNVQAHMLSDSASKTMSDFEVIQTIKVGRAPHGIRIEGDRLYVANAGADTIGIVDLVKGEQTGTFAAPHGPLDLIRIGDHWLVSAFGGSKLRRITETGEIIGEIEVGKSPSLFTAGHLSNETSIVSEFADQISFIDLNTGDVTNHQATGKGPYPGHITKDGVLAFIPNRTDGSVTVFDILNNIVAATVSVCKTPEGGTLTKDEVSYMVACGGDNKIVFINTASFEVTHTVSEGIGKRPFSVVAGPDGRYAYVNNAGGETISVIDLDKGQVVKNIKVGTQPIVMRIKNRKLYVANEVSDDIHVIQLPAKIKPTGSAINKVIMLGMIHSGHNTSEKYALDVVKNVIKAINPDYILTEIPPNRMEKALTDWQEFGEIHEPRVKRFAEYIGALFPLSNEMDFKIIPTAGWNNHMNDYRRAALDRLSKDPTHSGEWAEHEKAQTVMGSMLKDRSDDPLFIHSDDYDAITKQGLTPYDTYFNDLIGPGGWTKINKAHYNLIDEALNKHTGEGKTFLITFGAGHKYWFLEQLRKRTDIDLIDPKQFFN